MSKRRVNWPLVVLAILCLLPVAGGVALLLSHDDGGKPLGWALLGFFGSGVVVLVRRAFTPH